MRNILSLALTLVLLFLVGCASNIDSGQLSARAQAVAHNLASSDDAQIRCNGMELAAMLDNETAHKNILKGLQDPTPAVRVAAAIAAGDIKLKAAEPLLDKLRRDDNAKVRLAAGYALEKLGDNRFSQWFDTALLSDNSEWAGTACLLIGKLGNEGHRSDSRQKLWVVLRKFNQHPTVRLQAAEALARLGDQSIMERLSSYAVSGFADDRIIVVRALSYLDLPLAQHWIDVLCADTQIEVRLAAIAVSRSYEKEKFLPEVRQANNYSSSDKLTEMRVRTLALLALGHIGSEQDSRILYQAMNHQDPTIQAAGTLATIYYLQRQ